MSKNNRILLVIMIAVSILTLIAMLCTPIYSIKGDRVIFADLIETQHSYSMESIAIGSFVFIMCAIGLNAGIAVIALTNIHKYLNFVIRLIASSTLSIFILFIPTYINVAEIWIYILFCELLVLTILSILLKSK